MLQFLKLMIQLILSPAKGWEDVAADAPNPHLLFTYGLLPLAALTGATVFVSALWSHTPFFSLLLAALVSFAAYVVTYYVAIALLAAVLPRFTPDGVLDRNALMQFSSLCTGLMALIGLIAHLIPASVAVVEFLPVYVVVVMAMGRRFLNISDSHTGIYLGLCVVAVILPVYVIDWVLSPLVG